ncbi:MAG: glycosyltransferase family 4 protein [Ferruginibacter sp.]
MKRNNLLFLTLKVFSATGGIEKVCRVFGKSLYEYGVENNSAVQVYAMHGNRAAVDDNKYFPAEMFRSFRSQRIRCTLASVKKGCESRMVVISHINLLVIGWLIKKLSPCTQIVLFTHGIEVWHPLSRFKRKMLQGCDKIIAVSRFTADKLNELHHVSPSKLHVINNCLDPFLPLPDNEATNSGLRQRYGFKETDKVLFTLTRLSASERYKGYDLVMHAIVNLKLTHPEIRYLLSGSYDVEEKKYLDEIINRLGLSQQVVMTGYVSDEELAAHFLMADIYVMPSIKEGFGIVFIEAMYYGLPVLAGNKDGSVDALCDGKLGWLVDPLNVFEIQNAIEAMLNDKEAHKPSRELLLKHFSYDAYKLKVNNILSF